MQEHIAELEAGGVQIRGEDASSAQSQKASEKNKSLKKKKETLTR
jgi:hypothetical protein